MGFSVRYFQLRFVYARKVLGITCSVRRAANTAIKHALCYPCRLLHLSALPSDSPQLSLGELCWTSFTKPNITATINLPVLELEPQRSKVTFFFLNGVGHFIQPFSQSVLETVGVIFLIKLGALVRVFCSNITVILILHNSNRKR